MQIPRRKSEELRRRDRGPIFLTKKGIERLRDELLRLKRALPDLIAEAARTAAYGDRSENAEYKDAKANLRRANRRILIIDDQIKQAITIAPGTNASGTVALGSTVLLETNGVKKIFQILDSHETDPTRGLISYRSPLGAALMGHAKNDEITIQTGNGPQAYRILEIT